MSGRLEPRAIVIGAGVESLTAAGVLASHGLETEVLERRTCAGGRYGPCPGAPARLLFDRVPAVHPAVAHALAPWCPHATAPVHECAVDESGRAFELSGDAAADARAVGLFSSADSARHAKIHARLNRLAAAVAPLLQRAPPATGFDGDVWTALATGRRVLGLGRREMFELLRWPPMAVADLVEEWYESELPRALWASRGLAGTFAGPRSAGTAGVLLLQAAADQAGVRLESRGEPGRFVDALLSWLAANHTRIRFEADVSRVLVEQERVAGVELSNGERIEADVVVSGLPPAHTLLDLLEPGVLSPDIWRRVKNIRCRGSLARVILIADRPTATAPTRAGADQVWHTLDTVSDLERAFDAMKYGGWSQRSWMTVESRNIQGRAGAMQQVVCVTIRQVPHRLREGSWASQRGALAEAAERAALRVFPDLSPRLVERTVLTPDDLRDAIGTAGTHPWHVELARDQLWMARPALGLGGYGTPVSGLYLSGPGTHPGVGPLGTSGWLAARAALRDTKA
ncbi:MAG: phytoene desaturase family protein [Vicinamibacterales bacterium]